MDAPEADALLPPCAELSSQHAAFLDAHLASSEDLSGAAADLSSELGRRCADLDVDLVTLRCRIARLAVSWIYRSLGAKSLIQKSLVKLENLSVCASQYGVQSDRNRRTFGKELPRLAKEVQRIENIREYVGTASQLEALVGDLEDSVFFVNHQARNVLSGQISSSVLMATGRSREKLLHAIKTMNNIEDLVIDILKSRPRWGHLLKSVDSRVDKTLAVLRPKVIADHRSLLASLGWPPKLLTTATGDGEVSSVPNPLVLMQGAKRESFALSFLSLCALQHLQTRREERKQELLGLKEKRSRLWAIDELVSPIGARMEYHFTKWIRQPELIFALAFKVMRDFLVGVEDVLQPLIDKARLVAFSAREAWVFSMVQMLSGFLVKKVLPPLAESYKEKGGKSEVSTSWLNIIDLIIAFDSRMQLLVQSETCLYVGSDIVQCLTRGISVLNIFCEKPEWLKIWAKIEFKDAWKKFKDELRDERAWVQSSSKCGNGFDNEIESVDYLLATQDDHKAPLIADFVLKVAWAMIERCQKFPSLFPRVQFIGLTARKFIWCFLKVLISHCRIEELQSASFDDNDVIMRVCGSINAARYVEYKLVEWSDDVNFLDMCFADDMEQHENVDTGYNCFFGEEIKSLAELETDWLMEVIAFLLQQFEMLSWDYVENRHSFGYGQLDQDDTPSIVSSETDSVVSADLVIALDALGSQLTSIRRILNPKDFMDMWRNVADGLDHFLFHSMLASDVCFSAKGIGRFTADMRALYLVFQPFCARPEAFFPCIRDSLRLLNMNREEVKHLQMALSNNEKQIECLHVYGISHLSVEQAHELLRLGMCKLQHDFGSRR